MKLVKLFIFAAATMLITSCVNGSTSGQNTTTETVDSALVTATDDPSSLAISKIIDPLVEKYPNYKDNSIAMESLTKELNESLKKNIDIGKPCAFLEELPLEFVDVASNGNKEAIVKFQAPFFPFSEKWDVSIIVYCTMDKEQASKLSRGEYTLKGSVKDWQPDLSSYSINLGKFLIEDAQATPYTF